MKTEEEFKNLCFEYLERSPLYQEYIAVGKPNDPKFRGVKHFDDYRIGNKRFFKYPPAMVVHYPDLIRADMEQVLRNYLKIMVSL